MSRVRYTTDRCLLEIVQFLEDRLNKEGRMQGNNVQMVKRIKYIYIYTSDP